MLLYITNKAFIGRTFVISCSPEDSIARLKANIYHILYEMGRGSHQFRLKFKSQYLKDSSTIEDYGIVDSHVVNMIPLSHHSYTENPLISSTSSLQSRDTEDTLQRMLYKEVDTLKLREKLCNDVQVCMWVLFVFGAITYVTEYWYLAFHKCLFASIGLYLAPKYTRLSGFYMKINERNDVRILATVSLVLCASNILTLWIMHHFTCQYITDIPHCSEIIYFSVVAYFIEIWVFLGISLLSFILWRNFQFEIGNYIEPVLVEIRDIKYILTAANSKSTKEKRSAALDLANMAASSTDNKIILVAEGGLQVLIDLALSDDEPIRGYAIEAISELLTVKTIQDEFVQLGGINTLMFALHSSDGHVIKEAILAICQLCEDKEDNMAIVLKENGMDDLCHVISTCRLDCVRLVAGLFLDISFSDTLRGDLLKQQTHVSVFEKLIRSRDVVTQLLALQSLEMLALSSPELLLPHTSFVVPILQTAADSNDVQVKTISSKLILYFAQNDETCDLVSTAPELLVALQNIVHTSDNILQNVASKIMYSLVDRDRLLLDDDTFVDAVRTLRMTAVDQEAWMLTDKILKDLP